MVHCGVGHGTGTPAAFRIVCPPRMGFGKPGRLFDRTGRTRGSDMLVLATGPERLTACDSPRLPVVVWCMSVMQGVGFGLLVPVSSEGCRAVRPVLRHDGRPPGACSAVMARGAVSIALLSHPPALAAPRHPTTTDTPRLLPALVGAGAVCSCGSWLSCWWCRALRACCSRPEPLPALVRPPRFPSPASPVPCRLPPAHGVSVLATRWTT